MSFEDAEKRREAFVADLVEVCKKHRVMMDPDAMDWSDLDPIDIMFAEFNQDVSTAFYVGLDSAESAIRAGVWPVLHPVEEVEPIPVKRGNVVQDIETGRKSVIRADRMLLPSEKVVADRPHGDDDFSYCCGGEWCRCMQ